MTLNSLKDKEKSLKKELEDVREAIQNYDRTLHFRDASKPFNAWSLYEQSQLYNIDTDAYMWFLEHRDRTIVEYNAIFQSIVYDEI